MTPAPFLVPSLVTLRHEFDEVFPDRDHTSDGWIANAAHPADSDHQPNGQGAVRAIDVDADLRDPAGTKLIQVFEELRADERLEYLIIDRKIASRSHGWIWREYDGDDPHTGHGHISARHDGTGWSSTAGWGLEEMFMDAEEIAKKTWSADVIPVQNRTATWWAAGTLGLTYDEAVKAAENTVKIMSRLDQIEAVLKQLIARP